VSAVVGVVARSTVAIGRAMVAWARHPGLRGAGAAAVVTLSIAAALVEKWPLQGVLGGSGSGPFAVVSNVVRVIGDGGPVGLLAFVLYAAGRTLRWPRGLETSTTLAAAGIWCLALTQLGQFVFAEARPIHGGAMHFFAGGGHGVSGHASAATLLLWPLIYATRGARRSVRVATVVALVAWSLLVGITRVWLNMHFAWNVLAGWLVGEVTGRLAVRVAATSVDPPA
jgi:membrane-associated phospholipid phosphatase